jgi:hypothetical protein
MALSNTGKPASAYRSIVEKALASREWVKDGIDGNNHGILRHLPTGKTVAYQLGFDSGRDRNAVRCTAKDIERISGLKVWERSSRKPSKGKRPAGSGYTPRKSAAEQSISAKVDQLLTDLHRVDAQLRAVDRSSRAELKRAHRLAVRRIELADELAALHQPVPALELP